MLLVSCYSKLLRLDARAGGDAEPTPRSDLVRVRVRVRVRAGVTGRHHLLQPQVEGEPAEALLGAEEGGHE